MSDKRLLQDQLSTNHCVRLSPQNLAGIISNENRATLILSSRRQKSVNISYPYPSEHFAINMAKELGREFFAGFSNEVQSTLLAYAWPGNVRELKNLVERCVYRTEPEDLVDEVVFEPFASPFRPTEDAATQPQQNGSNSMTVSFPLDFKAHIGAHEVMLIEQAMAQVKHNQRKAADLLGLTYHQLRGYLRKYELVGGEPSAD